MTQYVQAKFEAPIPPWVTEDAISQAMRCVLDASETTFAKACKSRVVERVGETVLFDFAGLVSDDFDEKFDLACDRIALLAIGAFETELKSDTNENDINGAIFRRVVGPNSNSVDRFNREKLSAQMNVEQIFGGPSAHAGLSFSELSSDESINSFSCVFVDGNGWANTALAVSTKGLDAVTRRQAIAHALMSFYSMADRSAGVAMVLDYQAGWPSTRFELEPKDKALASLGAGDWKCVDRNPSFKEDGSQDFSFLDEVAGKTAVVVMHNGRVFDQQIKEVDECQSRVVRDVAR